jgi:hypothetical protein
MLKKPRTNPPAQFQTVETARFKELLKTEESYKELLRLLVVVFQATGSHKRYVADVLAEVGLIANTPTAKHLWAYRKD